MIEKPERGAPLRDGLPVQAPSPDGLGIIEGRRQAFEEAAEIAADNGSFEIYSGIRALIEEP